MLRSYAIDGRYTRLQLSTSARLTSILQLRCLDARQVKGSAIKRASNAQALALKDAFTSHREETVRQVERLEQVFG
jgi:ferritin-like metal-binding protein YciE